MSLILSLVLACAPEATELGSESVAETSATVVPSKSSEAPTPAEGRWLADLDNTDALLIDVPEGEWSEMAEVDGILLAGRYSVSGGYELVELAQGPVDDVLAYIDADSGLIELRATPVEGELRPPTGLDTRIEQLVAREGVAALLGEDGTTYHTLLAGAIDTETAVPPSSLGWTLSMYLSQGKTSAWTWNDVNYAWSIVTPSSGDADTYLWARPWSTWSQKCKSEAASTAVDSCSHSDFWVDFDVSVQVLGYTNTSFVWDYGFVD